jgi:long-chain acyl-CoA synthetase
VHRTVYDVIQRCNRVFPDQPALGTRDTLHIHEEETEVKKTIKGKESTEKKKVCSFPPYEVGVVPLRRNAAEQWKYFELSDYKYMSYKELAEVVQHVASGLAAAGISKGDYLNLYSQTSANWQILANGISF